MTELVLDHHREDCKTIVKASLEYMGSIDAYTDEGQRIVGKQEASIFGGNGARLLIDIPEMQKMDEQTVIEATAAKEVSVDMATNPQDIKSEFLETITTLRDRDVDDILDEMSQEMKPEASKEIASSGGFGDSQSTMGQRFIIMFVIFMLFSLLFGIVMTAAMMP